MNALPISGTGNWMAAGAMSLVGHVAVVALITSFEGTPPPDELPPITVELVVLDKAKPEPTAPAGKPSPDNAQMATSVMAMTKPFAPPVAAPAPIKMTPPDKTAIRKIDPTPATIFDTAPLESLRPNTADDHTDVSTPWSPPMAAVLLESTAQPRREPSPSSPSVTAAAAPVEIETPKQVATIAPLGAPPVEPMKPAPHVHLPQPKPLASPIELPSTPDLTEPAINADSTPPSDPSEPDIIITSADVSRLVDPAREDVEMSPGAPVADPPIPQSTSTGLTEEAGQVAPAPRGSVQLAGAVQPVLRPPGVTRGVQVVAGNRPPQYPLAARRHGLEGRVLLRVEVDSAGIAQRVAVTKSSGHKILDEAARRAAGKWQFLPALVGGEAASGAIDVPIVFRLD